MVDTDVVLIAIGVLSIAVRHIHALVAAKPSVACHIQAIARVEIIRHRHAAKEALEIPGCVELIPICVPWSKDAVDVPAKHAVSLEAASIDGAIHAVRRNMVAASINNRVVA